MSTSAGRDKRPKETVGAQDHLRVGAVSLLLCAGAILVSIMLRMFAGTVDDVVWFDALLLGAVTGLGGYMAVSLVKAARTVDHADAEARAYRRRLESVIEEMPIGVAVVENETTLSLVNERYRRLLRLDPRQMGAGIPIPALRVFDREGRALPVSCLPSGRAMNAGETVRGEEFRVESSGGKTLWLSVGAAPIRNDEGQISAAVVTVVDITQVKADEAERNRLLKAILEAQENERLRIARELHDELGQKLTALSIGLKTLEARGETAEPEARSVSASRQLVDEISESVRHITGRLRPLLLDEVGLALAAEDLALAWGEQMSIAIDTHIDELPADLSADTGIVAYRVIQESLTNVARHASASNVSVTLHRDGAHLRIAIEDDGVGFDRASAMNSSSRHFGLAGMEERVRSVGGRLDIESELGIGTAVFVSLPLRKE